MSDQPDENDDAPEDGGPGEISEERIAELEDRIEELSREIRSPPRGPLGLPRPPTPEELLAFVDDHAIPTTIAVLEANVRALKALRGAIGLLRRTERRDRGRDGRAGDLRERTDTVAREAVAELDRAVSDLATAIEGRELPDNPEARSVLAEIRSVRDEVASALEADEAVESDAPSDGADDPGSDGTDGGSKTDDGSGSDDESGSNSGTEIDVESELEAIKDEMRREGRSPDDGVTGDDEE